jgi:hypothetical protein
MNPGMQKQDENGLWNRGAAWPVRSLSAITHLEDDFYQP